MMPCCLAFTLVPTSGPLHCSPFASGRAAWGSVKCSQEHPMFLKPNHVRYLNRLRGL